jgi:hypothetical protein
MIKLLYKENASLLLELYVPAEGQDGRNALSRMSTDFFFTCATRRAAMALSQLTNTYLYPNSIIPTFLHAFLHAFLLTFQHAFPHYTLHTLYAPTLHASYTTRFLHYTLPALHASYTTHFLHYTLPTLHTSYTTLFPTRFPTYCHSIVIFLEFSFSFLRNFLKFLRYTFLDTPQGGMFNIAPYCQGAACRGLQILFISVSI